MNFQAGSSRIRADIDTADASKLSAEIKKELPGRQKEAEKKAEAWAASAGQKVDQAVSDTPF